MSHHINHWEYADRDEPEPLGNEPRCPTCKGMGSTMMTPPPRTRRTAFGMTHPVVVSPKRVACSDCDGKGVGYDQRQRLLTQAYLCETLADHRNKYTSERVRKVTYAIPGTAKLRIGDREIPLSSEFVMPAAVPRPAPVRCETCEDWTKTTFTDRLGVCSKAGRISMHRVDTDEEDCHSTLRKPEREPVEEWTAEDGTMVLEVSGSRDLFCRAHDDGAWWIVDAGEHRGRELVRGGTPNLRSAQLAAEDALAELEKGERKPSGEWKVWRDAAGDVREWTHSPPAGGHCYAKDDGSWDVWRGGDCVGSGDAETRTAAQLAAEDALAALTP